MKRQRTTLVTNPPYLWLGSGGLVVHNIFLFEAQQVCDRVTGRTDYPSSVRCRLPCQITSVLFSGFPFVDLPKLGFLFLFLFYSEVSSFYRRRSSGCHCSFLFQNQLKLTGDDSVAAIDHLFILSAYWRQKTVGDDPVAAIDHLSFSVRLSENSMALTFFYRSTSLQR